VWPQLAWRSWPDCTRDLRWSIPPAGDLMLGLAAWTRLHGIISLEIEGFFLQVGVDPARLYDSEIDRLISERLASRA
jgi:Tetracyclin repressor-like, C-terminal domain